MLGTENQTNYIGKAVERIEDAALLSGQGRFIDDLPTAPGTGHAAILRSPHAHADISAIDTSRAEALAGVHAVVTGKDAELWSEPFLVGVRQPMQHWCIATERVRYVGEPVAIVVAESRYLAEDALALIEVEYQTLPVVVEVMAAMAADAPILHSDVGSNLVNERQFNYGNPETAFADATHVVRASVRYPRNSCTPMECFGLVAEYLAAEQSYDVLANFQGPYALHPVMARALKVPGSRLRLRTPADSGGSFGVKQAIFPYIVAMALAARKARRPVKWVEDRLEHLVAANSATGRISNISAAVAADGVIEALELEQIEDCGAYLRAPEPASLYRMHGILTGAYNIPHLAVTNRIVLTNRTPSGLNRGFGGPQVYFALERLMQRIAIELNLDPLDVIRRNLVPAASMPYRAAAGAVLDSGDYQACVSRALKDGGLAELEARRDAARAAGRHYGIGFAAAVEPSISNMGYITTVMTPEERRRAGPKDGAVSTASIAVDPLGAVIVTADSIPQGQGHRTVAAQVVAEALGLRPEQITVNLEHDTQKDGWSIAAGNYSSRFAGAVAGTVHIAATRLAKRLAEIAAPQLNATPEDIVFSGGRLFARDNPDNSLSFGRVAGAGHWSPSSLPENMVPGMRETASWSPDQLVAPGEDDRINGSAAYGFIFDFCGVEIDADTGQVRIDKYVTMHDAGRRLNPALVDGQIRGAFAHAVGAALYEELAYGEDGSFLAGTFADYLVPTACEIPEPLILHHDSNTEATPLGAKGMAEGNCMSTPVCLANAVADALSLDEIALPMTPSHVTEHLHGAERPPSTDRSEAPAQTLPGKGRGLTGSGASLVPAPPGQVWQMLLDPDTLAAIIPGCESMERLGENAYRAVAVIRIGPIRGRFKAVIQLSDLDAPHALTLSGSATGPLGSGAGSGRVTLLADEKGTRISYEYSAEIGGKVAAVGGRMIDGAARILIAEFFKRFAAVAGGTAGETVSLWQRVARLLGLAR
ncbi:MAG: molybdopterin-dependent oxidoreductase [Rhodospirillaceae bacterium]|nr:molybdopterin-dependent oxidoreductase [Rhodospirillaceae bacterium]MBT5778702.1 molybdopterin-dependent oxidoreductase [Rhodospirillaceae bacterium]